MVKKMKFPKVTIIVLNWNNWMDTIECLESIYYMDYHNYQVILIDNASNDDSINRIRDYCLGKLSMPSNNFDYNPSNKPLKLNEYSREQIKSLKIGSDSFQLKELILIKNDQNQGFAQGNNIGIDFSFKFLKPDYILLLNNDTVIHPTLLSNLIQFAEKDEKIGIVGPSVYYYDDPHKFSFLGGYIDPCIGKIQNYMLNEKDEGHSSPIKLDYVSGCSLLIRKETINDIGLLDPQYFLYNEDVDWCLRAKKNGYKIFLVPKGKIWHKVSVLADENSLIPLYYWTRNQFLLVKTHCYNKRKYFFYFSFVIDRIMLSLLSMMKGQKNESIIIIRAVMDGIRGNYGFKEI
jgi:GT2 family glycosyltransferase